MFFSWVEIFEENLGELLHYIDSPDFAQTKLKDYMKSSVLFPKFLVLW